MRARWPPPPWATTSTARTRRSTALQEHVAALLGKEAALWLPSGTMANQVALRVLTRPGDDVVVSRESHAVWHETGGSAANAGVQLTEIGARGVFTRREFVAAVKPRGHGIYPPTTLVEIENTHNRAGGVVFAQDEARAHLRRGARARHRQAFSTARGSGMRRSRPASAPAGSPRRSTWSRSSFSKGLGAPGGSLLAGSRELIDRALRHRRMLGGAMRQVGIFAAAALHALEHHLARLARGPCERPAARRAAGAKPAASCSTSARVQTNIVVFTLAPDAPDAPALVAAARSRGVRVNALGARTIRALTHRDVAAQPVRRSGGDLGCSAPRASRASPRPDLGRVARAQAARARLLALVLLQVALADADRLRRDLDQLVVGDELDRVLQRQLDRRRDLDRVFLAARRGSW